MKPYASVNATNLLHALLCSLLSLDPSFVKDDIDEPTMTLDRLKTTWENNVLCKKNIGCAADGAAVNFGCRNGMITKYKEMADWFVGLHCFSHR